MILYVRVDTNAYWTKSILLVWELTFRKDTLPLSLLSKSVFLQYKSSFPWVKAAEAWL
jgi:hypothetical protein